MTAPVQTPAAKLPKVPAHAPRARVTAPACGAQPACTLEKWISIVGGRADSDLSLQHVDISRIHCAFVQTGDGFALIDLCSRLGTFVNNKRIRVAPLGRRDKVRVGPVELVIQWTSGASRRPNLRLRQTLLIELNGKRFELTELPALIGRRSGCEILVDTPDVSGAHTLLVAINGRPAAYDLGSRSGTIVNGQRVDFAWLEKGDRLVIGGETLYIGGAAAALPEPALDPAAVAEVLESTFGDGTGKDAGQLDKLLHLVQTNMASFSGRFNERLASLGHREAELSARADAVERASKRVEAQRRTIEQQAAEFQTLVDELKQREQELVLGEARLAIRKVSLLKAGARLRTLMRRFREERERGQAERDRWEGLAGEIGAAREQLAEERTQLERERAGLSEQQIAAQAREKRLAAAEREQARREQELSAREQALVDQEERHRATAARMQAFQQMLERASELFGQTGDPGPDPDPDDGSSGSSSPGGGSGEPAAGPPAASHNGQSAGGLPGPVIAQPIFAGASAGASAGDASAPAAPARGKGWRRLWS